GYGCCSWGKEAPPHGDDSRNAHRCTHARTGVIDEDRIGPNRFDLVGDTWDCRQRAVGQCVIADAKRYHFKARNRKTSKKLASYLVVSPEGIILEFLIDNAKRLAKCRLFDGLLFLAQFVQPLQAVV